jgi:hypothetical protein
VATFAGSDVIRDFFPVSEAIVAVRLFMSDYRYATK